MPEKAKQPDSLAPFPNQRPITSEELKHHLRSLSRFIYYVTEEEDRFLLQLQTLPQSVSEKIKVFNQSFGLIPLKQLTEDWRKREHPAGQFLVEGINGALTQIYKDTPLAKKDEQNQALYVITDPERWLAPDQGVTHRRLLNIAHQLHNDDTLLKIIFFVGSSLMIPQKLARYVEVVHDKGLGNDEIQSILGYISDKLKQPMDTSEQVLNSLKGLTSFEVDAVVSQSVIATKDDPINPNRIDLDVVNRYKQRQLRKTELVKFVDVSDWHFDRVGGVKRFKDWVEKHKADWTPEGIEFGLKPPKGLLLLGVWGCGKSISVKALGHAWNMPVVQLELGKLRSSAVGQSEANAYRAINLIESMSPCMVWIDEADKSLSGGAVSAVTDGGVTSRIIGILSNWLEESDKPFCLAMTANQIDTVPVEFVRRCDERFFFDLPDEEERVDILKIHLRERLQDPARYNLAELSEAAHLMVGSEIRHAIGTAMTESFHQRKPSLDHEILIQELKRKPRIIKTKKDEVNHLIEWVGYDSELREGIRAKLASDRDGGFTKYG